jgi:hypothetical protein
MKKLGLTGILPLVILIIGLGCSEEVGPPLALDSDDGDDPPPPPQTITCLSCHSSEQELKAALGPSRGPKNDPPALSDG